MNCSSERTPWAVICRTHGTVYLTEEQLEEQIRAVGPWICPHDGTPAAYDYQNEDSFS